MILISDRGKPVDNGSKKQEMFSKMQERKSEVKIVRKIVAIIAIVFVLIIGVVGILGYNYVKGALKPLDPNATKTIAVEVPIGSSLSSISTLLEKKTSLKMHVFLNTMQNLKMNLNSKQEIMI